MFDILQGRIRGMGSRWSSSFQGGICRMSQHDSLLGWIAYSLKSSAFLLLYDAMLLSASDQHIWFCATWIGTRGLCCSTVHALRGSITLQTNTYCLPHCTAHAQGVALSLYCTSPTHGLPRCYLH